MKFSFTQPICATCYEEREPHRTPVKMRFAETETCCVCGNLTSEGIYYRVDPTTVLHPTRTK